MKTVIVYFSYGGNTKQVVDYIKKIIDTDIVRLEPTFSYQNDYWAVVDQGQMEVQQDYRPPLKNSLDFIEKYNRIILCSPIWWYTLAPVVKSFLGNVNLKDKEIIPVITNGGYGLGHSQEDLKQLAAKSNIRKPLEIVFDEKKMKTPINTIDSYFSNSGDKYGKNN